MPLPPLYKYLNFAGAKLTLENGNFRHAKPSDFNDDMDMTIGNLFPEEIEVALEKLVKMGMARIVLENLDKPATCHGAEMRSKISLMQKVFRTNPKAVELIENEIKSSKAGDVYDVKFMRSFADDSVVAVNEFMQGYRVLCVTDSCTSCAMWERYADNHNGIVVRVSPNEDKASKFSLFRKVKYASSRPVLYESTREFIEDSIFAEQEKRMQAVLEKIIYTKTLEWEYEREYRLAIPIFEGENFDTLPYHSEELSELLLGAKMDNAEKEMIISLARNRNPDIKIFQASFNDAGNLVFGEL